MEDKFLQIISWLFIYGKVTITTIAIILGTQFIVYQASGHKINPLMWLYGKIFGLILKVAQIEA